MEMTAKIYQVDGRNLGWCNFLELILGKWRHWHGSLSCSSSNKLLVRWVIFLVISDNRNCFAGDALTSNSWRNRLFESIDRLTEWHAVGNALLELFASFLDIRSDSEFKHAEIFNAESLLEVTLRVYRNQFALLVEVVKLDGPDSFQTAAKGFSGLEGEGFVAGSHPEAFCFALVADFDALFGRHERFWLVVVYLNTY